MIFRRLVKRQVLIKYKYIRYYRTVHCQGVNRIKKMPDPAKVIRSVRICKTSFPDLLYFCADRDWKIDLPVSVVQPGADTGLGGGGGWLPP